jgi:GxxExxY protein
MSVVIEEELSNKVLGAVFTVHNVIDPGLLESAYEGALVIEFSIWGLVSVDSMCIRFFIEVKWSGLILQTWL